jgi:hypothetical protein
MPPGHRKIRGALAATAAGFAVLIATAAALAAGSVTKHRIASISVPAHQTRTLSVPYPDALEYGNARYWGHAAIDLRRVQATGRPASASKVKILEAASVEGGSAFEVRVYNANALGTAAVDVVVTATTVEPLPHS